MKKNASWPYLAVLAGVIAVSFSSLFVKVATAPPIVIAMYRLVITFVILSPFTFIKGRAKVKEISLKDKGLAALSGFFLALHFITWFTSLTYTSVASSVVIVTTQPIWVMIGSYLFFREKVRGKAVIGALVAVAGSVYIGAYDFQVGYRPFLGDLLALLGAWMVSGYFLIGRKLRSRVDLHTYTFYTYGSSSVVLVAASLIKGYGFWGYPVTDWLAFIGLSLVCTVLGHTVFNWALRYVQASVVTTAVLGEPVGAIFWAFIFLNEIPTGRQIIGGIIIMLGLFIFIANVLKR